MPVSDPARLRESLAAVMREAGALARATRQGPLKRWTKGDEKSPVCDGDIAVNNLLNEKLPPLVPEAGWLSEETEGAPQNKTATIWIVDPIDGTRAYLDGRADWTISVALAHGGRPVLAALYAPVTDEMFLAANGAGATLNGSRLKVSAGGAISGARLAGPQRYLRRLGELGTGIDAKPKIHSLALRITRVADGTLDAAFASGGSHDWDLAAADLLVHEAGGAMTDLAGHALLYNLPNTAHGPLLAAGPARHASLLDLVRGRQTEFA